MTTWDIRATIDTALAQEAETGQLRARITQHLAELEHTLLLPQADPASAVMSFITHYIESVPASLHLVAAIGGASAPSSPSPSASLLPPEDPSSTARNSAVSESLAQPEAIKCTIKGSPRNMPPKNAAPV